MREALRRSEANAERDRARTQDAGGPVTDDGRPLTEADTSDGELTAIEGPPEAPTADEEVAEREMQQERDEESSDEESDEDPNSSE